MSSVHKPSFRLLFAVKERRPTHSKDMLGRTTKRLFTPLGFSEKTFKDIWGYVIKMIFWVFGVWVVRKNRCANEDVKLAQKHNKNRLNLWLFCVNSTIWQQNSMRQWTRFCFAAKLWKLVGAYWCKQFKSQCSESREKGSTTRVQITEQVFLTWSTCRSLNNNI